MSGVRSTPVIEARDGYLTLADLREFVEAAALHSDAAKVRVKLVAFKEMAHPEGQPVKRLTIDATE